LIRFNISGEAGQFKAILCQKRLGYFIENKVEVLNESSESGAAAAAFASNPGYGTEIMECCSLRNATKQKLRGTPRA
jgi:hypothetical protein